LHRSGRMKPISNNQFHGCWSGASEIVGQRPGLIQPKNLTSHANSIGI
jgi:hypothetical protein